MSQHHSSTSPLVLLPYQSIPPGYGGLIHTPKPNDVLCGRGGRINSHEGNIQFRDIVNKYKEDYLSERACKVIKSRIAACIVSKIRLFIPAGRFLKVDTDTGLWVEIGDEKAKRKTGQALREDASKFRQLRKGDGSEETKERKKQETPTKRVIPDIIKNKHSHHHAIHTNTNFYLNECNTPPRKGFQPKEYMEDFNPDALSLRHESLIATSHQNLPLCKNFHPHTSLSSHIDEAPSVDLSNIEPSMLSGDDKTIDSYTLQVVMEMNDSTDKISLQDISLDSSYNTFVHMENTPKHKSNVFSDIDNYSSETGLLRRNIQKLKQQDHSLSLKMKKLATKKDMDSVPSKDKKDIRSQWRQDMIQAQAWRKKKNKFLADMFDGTGPDSLTVESAKVAKFDNNVARKKKKNSRKQMLTKIERKTQNNNKSSSEPTFPDESPTPPLQKQITYPPMDRHDSCTSLSMDLSFRDMLSLGSDSLTALYSIDDDKSLMKSFRTMMSISTGGTTLSDLTSDMLSLHRKNRKRVKTVETACC